MKLSVFRILGGLLAVLLGSPHVASADEDAIVFFKSNTVLELPSPSANVAPSGLLSCNSELYSALTTHSVTEVFRAVVDFDLADTLWTTPEGLSVRMSNLSKLYVLRAPLSQVDGLITELQGMPFVVFAERSVSGVKRVVPNDGRFHNQWAVNDQALGSPSPQANVQAIAAWDVTQGDNGVKIGIQEPTPGIVWSQHPELTGRVSGELNATVSDHSTHVAGIAAATGNNGQGVAGIDWHCQIVTRSFLGSDELVDDMHYMVDHDVSVINLEPHRDCRRLYSVRGWSHGQNKQVLTRGQRASGTDGDRARERARLSVGGDQVDCVEDRMFAGVASALDSAGGDGPGRASGADDGREGAPRRNSSERTSSCGGRTRFCARRPRISHRRSSTAERSDGVVHRRPSRALWGRADLRGAADRPVDVLRAQGAARRIRSGCSLRAQA